MTQLDSPCLDVNLVRRPTFSSARSVHNRAWNIATLLSALFPHFFERVIRSPTVRHRQSETSDHSPRCCLWLCYLQAYSHWTLASLTILQQLNYLQIHVEHRQCIACNKANSFCLLLSLMLYMLHLRFYHLHMKIPVNIWAYHVPVSINSEHFTD